MAMSMQLTCSSVDDDDDRDVGRDARRERGLFWSSGSRPALLPPISANDGPGECPKYFYIRDTCGDGVTRQAGSKAGSSR